MGRYLTIDGESDYKFWFASQPTSDILDFGYENPNIHGIIPHDSLEEIKEKVVEKKKQFIEEFKISYEEFIAKIDKKGYVESSRDEETQTEQWKGMERLGSWIDLGEHIIKKLEENGDDLYFEAEC